MVALGGKKIASLFNFTNMYIDNIVSINNPGFENHLSQLYPVELGVKDTTDSITSGSYLDLLLSIGSGRVTLHSHFSTISTISIFTSETFHS